MNRKRAMQVFGLFFILMLVFTLLSRAADSLTVARIQTRSPGKQVLTHTAAGTGKVGGREEEAVFVEPGQKVKKLCAQEGAHVKKGEVLLEVDLRELEEQIQAKERLLQQKELSIGDGESLSQVQAGQQSDALARAQADYETAAAKGDTAVARAEEALWIARNRLAEYEESQQGFQEEGQEIPDYSQRYALEDEIRAREQALEDAVAAREEALQAAARSIEDAGRASGRDSSAQIGALEKQEVELAKEQLQNLYAAGGQITAPKDGVITQWKLMPGDVTGEGAALLLVEESASYEFKAPIAEEAEQYVEVGAAITLEGSTELEKAGELTVTRVMTEENEAGEKGKYLVADLPQGVGEFGQSASYTVKKQSKMYNTCLPIAALHQENGRYFVYVVEEKKGVLGSELILRRQEVEVLEKNESYAALQDGALSVEQDILLTADREVTDGSRVRLEE